MIFDLTLIFALTAVNALFVMAEIAVVSVRRSRLEELRDDGDRRAAIVLDLLDSPENFLSTTQAATTFLSVLSGAIGGAAIAVYVTPFFGQFSYLAGSAYDISFVLVVFLITYLSLILGELVPKRWAVGHAESIALLSAMPLKAVMTLSFPIVRLFTISAEAVMRLLKVPTRSETQVTEEEIKIMLEHGERAGVVEEAEKEMIERVFRLGDKRLDGIMTHRSDMVWIDINNVTAETWVMLAESGHSYFPVCKESVDEVIGLISIKDLWLKAVNNEQIDINSLIQQPLVLPGSISGLRALERFRESKSHIALVVDEYGSVDGLVTINDIVEAVLGQLPSQDQEIDPIVVEREDGSFLIDGAMSYDEFLDLLNLQDLDEEEQRADFQTLAGFIINHLGRFPTVGERFEWSSHLIEVVDMDGHRIDKVLVSPPGQNQQGGEEEELQSLKEGNAE
ncbi:MAG: HlyC/CorC family transporter [Deltaproteobacteria bacterium]|nr:HlyC/CorC family transporter [Deltaproteobacteria bacterium]